MKGFKSLIKPISKPRRIKHSLIMILTGFITSPVFCAQDLAPQQVMNRAVTSINALVAHSQQRMGVTPPSIVSDEILLRRATLNIIGRIPTLEETQSFLESRDAKKRDSLIERLINSPGYESRQFTFWANLLRIKTTGGRNNGGEAHDYAKWLKQAIKENRPYDTMVRQLLTAEGYPWEDGATGYYLRDIGMPLDNMSNTTRVFLGTEMVCAQCHDHPFDEWTRKDYLQMAAFRYGLETKQNLQQIEELKAVATLLKKDKSLPRRSIQRTVKDLFDPLSYEVIHGKRPLKFPKDYQYEDAKVGSVVEAKTIFDSSISASSPHSKERLQTFVQWMTSPDNPRFAMVMANRLWKQVFGLAVMEPVDAIRDNTKPRDKALLSYLTNLLIELDYDMKSYLNILYSTTLFQSECDLSDDEAGDMAERPFLGPSFRRMSAEEIWDSLMTLAIENIDNRPGEEYLKQTRDDRTLNMLSQYNPKELYEHIKSLVSTESEYLDAGQALRREVQALQKEFKTKEAQTLQRKFNQLRKSRNKEMFTMQDMSDDTMMGSEPLTKKDERKIMMAQTQSGVWEKRPRGLVRASELSSPAPAGHPLQIFGQSDRELIDNDTTAPNTQQFLFLMNAPILHHEVMKRAPFLEKVRSAKNQSDKIDLVYLATLNRSATPKEQQHLEIMLKDKNLSIEKTVLWSLLNSQEFVFVQ